MSLKDYSKKQLVGECLRLNDVVQEQANQLSVIGEMVGVEYWQLTDIQKVKDKIRLLRDSAQKKES